MSGTIRTTKGRGRLYDSILDTVGDTPVIRVNNLAPKGVTIYVKAEFFNPAASVKDRLALNIIEAAERSGALKPGQTVVEATSGNTGIGLAMVDGLASDGALTDYPYLYAARADMLRRLERWSEAATDYERALALTDNGAEQAFLRRRLAEMQARTPRRIGRPAPGATLD